MNNDIKVLEFDNLPYSLRRIPDPPRRIFYRGCLETIFSHKKMSVVGARKNTPYGERCGRIITSELARHDITICSGLALGIDAIAMKAALDAGGKVIGVMASGLSDRCLGPKTNFNLAMEILEKGGVLISEYEPDVPAQKYYFPHRNRLISALSMGTIIIEADIKSGSLITGHCALAQGKDVFAVPGDIFSEKSRGTNFLISQGAIPVISEKEILYFYGIKDPFEGEVSTLKED